MAKRGKAGRPRKPNKKLPLKSLPNLYETVQSPELGKEEDIFTQLELLCREPGYIHALCALVFRDNVVTFGETVTKEDYQRIYHPERLIRTEITVLIGLWLRGDRSIEHPGAKKLRDMMEKSDRLLHELHAAMIAPTHRDFMAALQSRAAGNGVESPMGSGSAMREAIFYAAESAFPYQYTDFAKARYREDRAWLMENAGFTIDDAATFISELIDWLADTLQGNVEKLRSTNPNYWTFIDLFCFTIEDAVSFSSLDKIVVEKIIYKFSVPDDSKNENYVSAFARNQAAIFPFIRLNDGRITMLLEYVGCEAIYASPAYWMREDLDYLAVASENRGKFAESEAVRLLGRAFPEGSIFRNVIFRKTKKKIAGELDALVIHGRRAFMIQIKSKGLTEGARAGDEIKISKDFEEAVQKSYDQAVSCVKAAKSGLNVEIDSIIVDRDIFKNVDEYYPICISSENYPSLSHQVSQFLKTENFEELMSPIVLDIFTLDVITEFLRTPLYVSDYLCKRARLLDNIIASHELNIFGMHLKNNLHIEDNVTLMMVEDDFVLEIDIALNARRRGLPGKDTPAGLLTRDLDNPLGRMLQKVDTSERADVHQLGEFLLSLSSQAWDSANKWIERAIREAQRDSNNHDVTIPLSDGNVGLTVHCNNLSDDDAFRKLVNHVEMRKYIHKAGRWFGVCMDPSSSQVRFALGRLGKWKFDPTLDDEAKSLKVRSVPRWVGPGNERMKAGRNSPCPCGSGIKYKRCCLRSD
ncbi:SEC-C metal-binding domain-containing protein [Porphyrobacter sp. LM 6]|uniref:SEC-C metal-binding domain-containing protein n=1 Tax=Porphyrobacter sp. LM 6 TaxID=1896196 RepID=UPI000863B7CF|nr:SEC-C metal-binding domain-containing protein [Porphyrobacter sp. LM 6]AOL95170.1 Nuclease-related domain-containing protein [Porphyrobacter sp. LM 6]